MSASSYHSFSNIQSSASRDASATTVEQPPAPQEVSVSVQSIATIPAQPSTASFIVKLVVVFVVTTAIGCAGVGIVVAVASLRNSATGPVNYSQELTGNGYHGIQKVRYYSTTRMSNSMRYGYPIGYMSGTTFSGTYVNNAWYGFSASCSSSSSSTNGGISSVSGVATCTGICKSLGKSYVGVTTGCSTGYIGNFATYVSPDRAIYTTADTTATAWVDYGQASTCVNAMVYCDCTV